MRAKYISAPSLQQSGSQQQISDIPAGFVKVGDLKPTFYWITLERENGQPRNRTLLGPNDEVLANVSQRFYTDINMEGTGRLLDGRLLNFFKFVDTPSGREIRYRECGPEAPYGYGKDERKLEAFHSVAVDTRLIPLDSQVYIPAAKGTVLPDGSIHDGYFMAVDIGDAIQDYRIDIFTSFGDQSSVFSQNGLVNMRATPVYVKKVTQQ